jgi:hypothetical protein
MPAFLTRRARPIGREQLRDPLLQRRAVKEVRSPLLRFAFTGGRRSFFGATLYHSFIYGTGLFCSSFRVWLPHVSVCQLARHTALFLTTCLATTDSTAELPRPLRLMDVLQHAHARESPVSARRCQRRSAAQAAGVAWRFRFGSFCWRNCVPSWLTGWEVAVP